MKKETKDYPLRLDRKTMFKLHYIAQSEDRPISRELTRLVRKRIAEFEAEHGVIETPFDDAEEK